jgi:hypothetical protein
VKKITIDITNTPIYLAIGEKEFEDIQKKHSKSELITIGGGGKMLSIHYTEDNSLSFILIGLNSNLDVYEMKALLVHELSHAVTTYFLNYGFNDDELRSYLLQYLYLQFVKYIDQQLSKIVKAESVKEDEA